MEAKPRTQKGRTRTRVYRTRESAARSAKGRGTGTRQMLKDVLVIIRFKKLVKVMRYLMVLMKVRLGGVGRGGSSWSVIVTVMRL